MKISDKFNGQEILDRLAHDITDSIDNEILYEAMGWTIVEVPYQHASLYGSKKIIEQWVDENLSEHFYWDGKYAFKNASDASVFLLRWS